MVRRTAADHRPGVELFAITPGRGDAAELCEKIASLAAGGVGRILLREKQLEGRARIAVGEAVAAACATAGIELWISEDVALARSLGAAGVHLPERSPPPSRVRSEGLLLGVSLHRPVSRGVADLASCCHAFLAPLYPTPSKPEATPLLPEGFQALAASLPATLRCFALGGITLERLPELARHGIRRIAAIRLFFDAREPERAASVILERLAEGDRAGGQR